MSSLLVLFCPYPLLSDVEMFQLSAVLYSGTRWSTGRTDCFHFLCDVLMFCFVFWFSAIFVFLIFWIDNFLMHPAFKIPAMTSVLPQKPSLTIICVIPAITGLHHLREKPSLLSHRLRFGRFPWRCLWKMEGEGGYVVPQGVSWRHQWSPLPLGKAQNVTHAEEWPPREINSWIRRCHNND